MAILSTIVFFLTQFTLGRLLGIDYETMTDNTDESSMHTGVESIGPRSLAMMDTRQAALAELEHVFALIAQEHLDRGVALPKDTAEIVYASRDRARVSARRGSTRLCEAAPDRQPRAVDA